MNEWEKKHTIFFFRLAIREKRKPRQNQQTTIINRTFLVFVRSKLIYDSNFFIIIISEFFGLFSVLFSRFFDLSWGPNPFCLKKKIKIKIPWKIIFLFVFFSVLINNNNRKKKGKKPAILFWFCLLKSNRMWMWMMINKSISFSYVFLIDWIISLSVCFCVCLYVVFGEIIITLRKNFI